MLTINTIGALLSKQIKDVLKNKQVLILFFVYPLIAVIMTKGISANLVGEERFFTTIFATMHSVFTPLVVTAALIAEEKEKHTLSVLMMAGVRAIEYLVSIGSFVLIGTLITGSLFLGIENFTLQEGLCFLGAMCIGSLLSIILGMSIGAYAPNAMSANGIAVPVAMVFAFLPMLASFNEKINKVAVVTYSEQISRWLTQEGVTIEGGLIVIGNGILLLSVFLIIFRKNRLEE